MSRAEANRGRDTSAPGQAGPCPQHGGAPGPRTCMAARVPSCVGRATSTVLRAKLPLTTGTTVVCSVARMWTVQGENAGAWNASGRQQARPVAAAPCSRHYLAGGGRSVLQGGQWGTSGLQNAGGSLSNTRLLGRWGGCSRVGENGARRGGCENL